MNTMRNQLLQQALRLPAPERASLAAELIDSLEGDADPGAEEAWGREIARRIRDYETGECQPIPWDQARQMILGTNR
jgi:putative addiction module component (TIGR02574 family)